MKKFKMPVMKPLPIKTKGLIWYHAIWVWLTTSRQWEIMEDWYFLLPWLGFNNWCFIPKGFIFDGASIPRWLWIIFSPIGILFIPGLIHDFVYRYEALLIMHCQEKELDYIRLKVYNRIESDLLFKEVSILVNGFKFLNWGPYLALVVAGGFTWRKHRKNNLDVVADFPELIIW